MCQDAQVDTNPTHKHASGSKSLPTCAVIYASLERGASSNKYTPPLQRPVDLVLFLSHTQEERSRPCRDERGSGHREVKMCVGVRVGSLWWNQGLCSTCRVSSPHVLFVRS